MTLTPSTMGSSITNENFDQGRLSPSSHIRTRGIGDRPAPEVARDDPVSPASSTQLDHQTTRGEAVTDLRLPAAAIDHTRPTDSARNSGADDAFSNSVDDAEKGHVKPSASYGMEHGIYWRSPFLMVFAATLGVACCLGHHFLYMSLRGLPANVDAQQMYMREGNILAWLAQLFMTTSVWIVYTQWLWLSLADRSTADTAATATAAGQEKGSPDNAGHTPKGRSTRNGNGEHDDKKSNTTTLRILDVVTSVESSIISLLHFWLFKNLKTAYVLAITAWCLQIPSLLTPSALVVVPSMNVTSQYAVPIPGLNNPGLNVSFAYDSPMTPNAPKNASDVKFVGARTVVLTIGSGTASSGILDITPPVNESSYQGYSVTFDGPYVSCSEANEFQTEVIDAVVHEIMGIREGTYLQWVNAFSAFIPVHGSIDVVGDTNTTTVVVNGTQMTALWDADLQRPLNTSSNEIWMRFYRYQKDSSGYYVLGPDGQPMAPTPYFLTCQLFNATYDVSFSWNNGIQSVVSNSIQPRFLVPYPNDTIGYPSDVVVHAYSSIFLAVANEVVGTMAFYNDTDTNSSAGYAEEPPTYSSFRTRIIENSLTGSDDLDYYFAVNKQMYSNNPFFPLSLQRLQDKAVSRNRTLDLLIEELSFNITVSLLHDPLLTDKVNVTAFTHANDGNQYDYIWSTVATAYSLAIAATLIANLLGFWAFRRNRAAFDQSFSTIVSVTRGRELDRLFPTCCHGVAPLPQESLTSELLVKITSEGRRPGRNIVLADKDVKPVCKVCNRPRPSSRRSSQRPSAGWRRRFSIPTSPPATQPPGSPRSSRAQIVTIQERNA